jgi:protein-disulfide isomerase
MIRYKTFWLLAVWLFSGNLLLAQAPSVLNYQGRITVADAPFNGQGYFTFVILDNQGVILWASGEFPFEGTTKMPAAVVKAAVNNGAYSVRLGDTSAGMPALDAALLRSSASPRLRVWFNDGTRGWQKAGEDVSLAAALGTPGDANGALNGAQADSILRELRDLRAKLDRQQANPTPQAQPQLAAPTIATVSVGSAPSEGISNAPLVLVEFTDFQCGFCKRFHDTVMADLKKDYIDTGKLRVVSRNLPLSFHPNAEPAAQASLCAHQQEKYWPMREKLFGISTDLTAANVTKAAEEVKLDMTAFRQCIDAKTFAGQVAKDAADATAVGISGTPSFVLGKLTGDKVTGKIIVGAMPYAAFEGEIKKMLATAAQ